jgi:hypothetical protein
MGRQSLSKPTLRGDRPPAAGDRRLCPFRTLLGPLGEVSIDTLKARRPDAVSAVLGFTPEDLEPTVLDAIVGQLKAKRLVLLVSNQRDLRDYAKREILLAVNPTLGSA